MREPLDFFTKTDTLVVSCIIYCNSVIFQNKLRGKERPEWGLYNLETKTFGTADEFDTKQMRFEGTGDPNTRFYCNYNDGRLVKSR